jgi:hypothetical protein
VGVMAILASKVSFAKVSVSRIRLAKIPTWYPVSLRKGV